MTNDLRALVERVRNTCLVLLDLPHTATHIEDFASAGEMMKCVNAVKTLAEALDLIGACGDEGSCINPNHKTARDALASMDTRRVVDWNQHGERRQLPRTPEGLPRRLPGRGGDGVEGQSLKVIIAGSRDIFPSAKEIQAAVNASGYEVTILINGRGRGVDLCAGLWAEEKQIPIEPFPALWRKHGKAAGPIRNEQMACAGDALIAIWDVGAPGKGTPDVCKRVWEKGKPVFIVSPEWCRQAAR